jgi:hypothetical protein
MLFAKNAVKNDTKKLIAIMLLLSGLGMQDGWHSH